MTVFRKNTMNLHDRAELENTIAAQARLQATLDYIALCEFPELLEEDEENV